jgi:hypothetical protein
MLSSSNNSTSNQFLVEGEGVFGLVEYVEVYAGGAALDEGFERFDERSESD